MFGKVAYRQHGRRHVPSGSDATRVGLFAVSIFGPTASVTVGDYANPIPFFIPSDLGRTRLWHVELFVVTVSSSGKPTVQIHNVTQNLDMLSTKVSVDANEKTSLTAATPVVINQANSLVQAGDEIRFDVDIAGTGTKGMLVKVGFW